MNTVSKICVAVALLFIASAALAQTTTIRIRFANGKSGKPLRLKSYFIEGAGMSYKNYTVVKVDKDSLIVTFKDVTTFAFSNMGTHDYYRCDADKQSAPQVTYNLQEIVQNGAVSPNFCGPIRAKPVPGELLIYNRHPHLWEFTKDTVLGLLVCG
jgi:hypothetical protein